MVMMTQNEKFRHNMFPGLESSQVVLIPYDVMASCPREEMLLEEINERKTPQLDQQKTLEEYLNRFKEKLETIAKRFVEHRQNKVSTFAVGDLSDENALLEHFKQLIKEKTSPELDKLEKQMNDKIKEFSDRIKKYDDIHNAIKSRGIKRRKMKNQVKDADEFLSRINEFNNNFRIHEKEVKSNLLKDRENLEFFELKLAIFERETPEHYLKNFLLQATTEQI